MLALQQNPAYMKKAREQEVQQGTHKDLAAAAKIGDAKFAYFAEHGHLPKSKEDYEAYIK